jgi:hypothetical protein
MEYKDINTGMMTPVNPDDRVTTAELKADIEELKAMIAQLLVEKGV